jgi:FMN phosphatase YigB (HAD superfamily)
MPERSQRALLFDFGGTLDADGLRWSVRFHAAYASLGGVLGTEAFEVIFRASDRALLDVPGITTLGLRAMIVAQSALLRRMVPDGDTVDFDAVADRVYRDAVKMADRNRPILDGLASTDEFRLGVVSNFTGNLEHCLAELDLLRFFDVVTDSAVFGAAKPDLAPFRATLSALGVEPANAWMIGDNFDADIRPARRLSMRGCWLTTPDREAPADCAPDARIAHLSELPAVVCTG